MANIFCKIRELKKSFGLIFHYIKNDKWIIGTCNINNIIYQSSGIQLIVIFLHSK